MRSLGFDPDVLLNFHRKTHGMLVGWILGYGQILDWPFISLNKPDFFPNFHPH